MRELAAVVVIALLVVPSFAGGAWGPAIASGTAGTTGGLTPRPFVFLAQSDGGIGGFAQRYTTTYAGALGKVQVSEESNDGVLLRMQEGHAKTADLIRRLDVDGARIVPANATMQGGDPGVVREQSGPIADVRYSTPGHPYVLVGYHGNAQLAKLAELIAELRRVTAASRLTSAPAGIYIRALRLPNYFADYPAGTPRTTLVDGVLPADATAEGELKAIFADESSLVRIAALGQPVLLNNRFVIVPGHPLRIQLGDEVFHLAAYRLGA